MSTAFSMAPLFRSSVGFDRFNDLFETALRNEPGSTYPPYNVEKHGDDQYRIVVAAAGFQEEDLELQVEKGVLTISGGKRDARSGGRRRNGHGNLSGHDGCNTAAAGADDRRDSGTAAQHDGGCAGTAGRDNSGCAGDEKYHRCPSRNRAAAGRASPPAAGT